MNVDGSFGSSRGAVDARARAAHAVQRPWWQELGFADGPPRSLASAEAGFRRRAATAHPDRGGSAADMQRLLAARSEARRHYPRGDRPVTLRDARRPGA